METIFKDLHLQGFLSFAPDAKPIKLERLNVLIGPNGSGKSNLIEGFELLAATPKDLSQTLRMGGRTAEWIWQGSSKKNTAYVSTSMRRNKSRKSISYSFEFTETDSRIKLVSETVSSHCHQESNVVQSDELLANPHDDYSFYDDKIKILRMDDEIKSAKLIDLSISQIKIDQSILSQRIEPDLYPTMSDVAEAFSSIRTFREWGFGRDAGIRKPQDTSLPSDSLMPNASNLALVLNEIEHRDRKRLNDTVSRYLPRFERLSTRITNGTIQFYLHEKGLNHPIPASRISDGTLRFLAILAALLVEKPPSVLCIEEPELGQHPDAVVLIAELLKEASKRMQIIVTTHSEALISALSDEPQAVMVCENNGFGTEIRRLDPEKMQEWLKDYSLGDLWRSGELGGNP